MESQSWTWLSDDWTELDWVQSHNRVLLDNICSYSDASGVASWQLQLLRLFSVHPCFQVEVILFSGPASGNYWVRQCYKNLAVIGHY